MSDRTPSTDALETLGMIHFKPEKRDAIHLAVDPARAPYKLFKSDPIGVRDGIAYLAGTRYPDGTIVQQMGIVDPFLPRPVQAGESFWFIMNPRMVTSLRHVWTHPDFPEA